MLIAAFAVRVYVARTTPLLIPGYNEAASQVYVQVAQNFLAGDGWVWNGKPASQHPPGYSLFLAGLLPLFAERALSAARIAQCALDAATLIPIWIVARRIAPAWAAWLVVLAYAFLPEFVRAPIPLLAEALIPFPIMFAIAAACLWNETSNRRWLVASGLSVGTALLLRSEVLVLAPAAALWLGAVAWRNERSLLRNVGLFLIVVLMCYGPWVAWRAKVRLQGHALPSVVATTVLSGLGQFPNRYGLITSDRFTGAIMHYHELPWHLPAGDAYAAQLVSDIVREDPWLVVRAILRREFGILTGVNLPNTPAHAISRRVNRGVLFIALLGALFALISGRIRTRYAWLATGPALIYCCTLGILYYEPRYVVPAHVSLLWLGAAAATPQPVTRRRPWLLAVLALAFGGYALGRSVEHWHNHRVAKGLRASIDSADWQPAQPSRLQGAELAFGPNDAMRISGRPGTAGQPGFVGLWEDVPAAEGERATVLVDLELIQGSVTLSLSQTNQFENQPPERLWLVRERLAAPRRCTVVLPIKNFTGRAIDLVLLPTRGTENQQGFSGDTVQCRVYKVRAWLNGRTPSRPFSMCRPAGPSAS